MPSISVVIPVFNGNATLNELHERLAAILLKGADPYEVIFGDDGSTDQSWQTITKRALTDPCIRGLRHNRNYGQHNALLTGMRYARYDIIVTLDDDLQNARKKFRNFWQNSQKAMKWFMERPKSIFKVYGIFAAHADEGFFPIAFDP